MFPKNAPLTVVLLTGKEPVNGRVSTLRNVTPLPPHDRLIRKQLQALLPVATAQIIHPVEPRFVEIIDYLLCSLPPRKDVDDRLSDIRAMIETFLNGIGDESEEHF